MYLLHYGPPSYLSGLARKLVVEKDRLLNETIVVAMGGINRQFIDWSDECCNGISTHI